MTVILGLASRRFSFLLPGWLAKNAGDVLYATMAFWLAAFFFPALSTFRAAFAAALFCFCIEFLKFSQAEWMVAARHNQWGALVFGIGFHFSNLVCTALACCSPPASNGFGDRHGADGAQAAVFAA